MRRVLALICVAALQVFGVNLFRSSRLKRFVSFCLRPFDFSIVLGSREIDIQCSPFQVSLLLMVGLLGFAVSEVRSIGREQELQQLRQQASSLQESVNHERAEKEQLAAAAQARTAALSSDLEQTHQELRKVWSTLEKRGQSGPALRPTLQSRSGTRISQVDEFRRRCCEMQGQALTMAAQAKQAQSAALEVNRRQQEAEAAYLATRTPSGRPCRGEMTSPFGYRIHPIYGTGRFHKGCDFTTDYGMPIHATAAGIVVHSDWLGGYGQVVEIDHGQGVHTLFAHCGELKVKKGQRVQRGQLLGTVGMTGLTSGPHCHYEVHVAGQPVDPAPYFANVSTAAASPVNWRVVAEKVAKQAKLQLTGHCRWT